MSRNVALGAAVALLVCGAALAQERKVYKYTDEKGNVVYSETPPMSGGKAKQIDASPAYRGHGGHVPPASPYDDPRRYSGDTRQQPYKDAMRERERQQEEARQKRLAELEAQCVRNRGTDCKDPEALRYQESTKVPGGYRGGRAIPPR